MSGSIPVSHYIISWFDDYIHEYGYNKADEYFLIYKGRGLIFNINKATQEQNMFFSDKPRNEYSVSCSVKVHALMDEVQLPLDIVQSCYEIASIKERLQELTKALKIPSVDRVSTEDQKQLFNNAVLALKAQEYDTALKGFTHILRHDPSHVESLYNCACIHSMQGNLDIALEWLERTFDAGYTDVLHIISDTHLSAVSGVSKKFIRKIYRKCIMDNFQGNRCMIDLQRYNQIYSGNYTSEHLDKLREYGINRSKPWQFGPGDLDSECNNA